MFVHDFSHASNEIVSLNLRTICLMAESVPPCVIIVVPTYPGMFFSNIKKRLSQSSNCLSHPGIIFLLMTIVTSLAACSRSGLTLSIVRIREYTLITHADVGLVDWSVRGGLSLFGYKNVPLSCPDLSRSAMAVIRY